MARCFPGVRRTRPCVLAIVLLVMAPAATRASILDDPAAVMQGRMSAQSQRVCQGVFVTGLTPARYDAILHQYNKGKLLEDLYPGTTWRTVVNQRHQEVTITGSGGSLASPVRQTTRRVRGYGCVPLGGDGKLGFRPTPPRRRLLPPGVADRIAWPVGDRVPPYAWRNSSGRQAIDADVAQLFADPGQYSFTLSHHGRIIYEHYQDGIGAATPVDGYSLTKSAIATLIGALVQKGWLRLSDPGGLPEWRTPSDPRGKVTVDNLLRMESGLSFPMKQPDGSTSFAQYDLNALAATEIPGDTRARLNQLQVETSPGGLSHYLNANYELLAARAAEVLARHGLSVTDGFYNLVFDKLDMRTFEFRADAAGNIAGPRHAAASARDWAKLGQLYLKNGRWLGQQILPPWWRSYVSTSSGLSDGGPQTYGAGFYLSVVGDDATQAVLANQPPDALFGWGAQYQYIVMWPTEDVVMTLNSDGADTKMSLPAFEHLSGVVLNLVHRGALG